MFDTSWRYSLMEDTGEDRNVVAGRGHYAPVTGTAYHGCQLWARGLLCPDGLGAARQITGATEWSEQWEAEQYVPQVAQQLTLEAHAFAAGGAAAFSHSRPAFAHDYHESVAMGTRNMRDLDASTWQRDPALRDLWMMLTLHSTDYRLGIEVKVNFAAQWLLCVLLLPSLRGDLQLRGIIRDVVAAALQLQAHDGARAVHVLDWASSVLDGSGAGRCA